MNAPPILPWYRAYCAAMIVMYLGVVAMGAWMLTLPDRRDPPGSLVFGVLCIGMGVALAAGFALALLVPPKPWGWVVGMVAICISLTSCACMPAGIPLLIYWLKPETKEYFGHS